MVWCSRRFHVQNSMATPNRVALHNKVYAKFHSKKDAVDELSMRICEPSYWGEGFFSQPLF